MTHDDTNRPEPDPKDHGDGRQEQAGQVSEMAQPDLEAGGADATDKSTGTAPDRAEQPDE